MALIFAVGGSVACSSSTKNPTDGGGGTGAGGSGTGGHDAGAAGAGVGGAGVGGAAAGGRDGGSTTDGSTSDVPVGDAAAGGDSRPDIAILDASGPDSPSSISLTSTALAQGAVFMVANTCAGVNTSPPLTWTAGPAGTMSYSVALTDLSNAAVHWVIWDIPAATTSLPAVLPGDTTLTTPPVGAKQLHKAAFFGTADGAYRGPCPAGDLHLYQFQVNAIGTATLAGVAGATSTELVQGTAQAASLAYGNLVGTSTARMPPPSDAGGQ